MATNLLGLNDYIRKGYEEGRAQGDQQRLRSLAPQVLSGDAGATAQAYALDPQAAQAYEKGADRIGTQVYNVASSIKRLMGAGQEASAANLYRQFANSSGARMRFPDIPRDWDAAAIMPVVDQIMAQTEGANSLQGAVQSTYINGAGQRVAIMRDGTQRTLGDAENRLQLRDQPGLAPGAFDPRSGTISPVREAPAPGGGGGTPQVYIDPALPPALQADIRANPQKYEAASAGVQQQAAPPAATGVAAARPEISAAEQQRLELAQQANQRAIGQYDLALRAADRADRQEQRQVQASAVTGKPPTEDERKAAGWVNQARNAFSNMEKALLDDPEANQPGILETYIPIDEIANRTRSDARQRYVNGASSFSEAALRAATGAGVNKEEAEQKIRELTPQRGDSAGVRKQKRDALEVYLGSLEQRAGRALQQSSPTSPRAPAAAAAAGPAVGTVEGGYRFRGGNPADPNAWERL